MDIELRCPVCAQTFCEPVLLPCMHALCRKCACSLQRGVQVLLTEPSPPQGPGATPHHLQDQEPSDGDAGSDKASVYSETDSGVVVASRPTSYVSNPEVGAGGAGEGTEGHHHDGEQEQGIRCPECHKIVALGHEGAQGLPIYTAMARIISRQRGEGSTAGDANSSCSSSVCSSSSSMTNSSTLPPCQLCEGPPRPANTECQQCQILYCSPCLTSCHPSRGPLSTHTLVPVRPLGGTSGSSVSSSGQHLCSAHGARPTHYCLMCRWSGCQDCAQGHLEHDLQPLDNISKTHKVS
ncbi:unnamed protein product, partial [Meganyctiphanes norvegica]